VDLRKNGRLSVDDSILIDSLEEGVRAEYNEFIGQFIEVNKLRDINLFLTASCRNTLVSGLHDTFCRIALLEARLKSGYCPKTVLVDNAGIANLVNQMLCKYDASDVVIQSEWVETNLVLRVIKNFLKSVYVILCSWFLSRLFLLKKRPPGGILFVDTFLFQDSFDGNGHYHDRYYTGHEEYLSVQQKNAIWFAPTLYGIRYPWEYVKLFRAVTKANRNFLIKEAWLSFGDYAYSLMKSFVIPFRVKCYPRFRGLDVSELIRREILSDIASVSLVRALCQYRFIRRLAIENINIQKVINWSENQVNDRALNLSFKKHYPSVLTHGYQGFLFIGYYASLQPTCYELETGTLPDILHVINEYCLRSHKQICGKLRMELSPAFRFSYLSNIQDRRKNNELTVLIPLPGAGMLNESIGIIKSFLQISDQLGSNIKAVVKLHPSYSRKKFIKLAPEFSDQRLEYSDENISVLLEMASVLISTASSVCVEAVSVGVPVAIYGSRSGVTMNPVPLNISTELWRIFYTPEHLIEFILDAQNINQRISNVADLFLPVNAEGTQALFACAN